jgi:peroxiredoxin/predicted 2-oxoglutarate/Fe(II)-dependent dioxygenase YbiX
MTPLFAPSSAPAIALADPVPWFSARTVTGETVDLHVDAGRWVVLCFLGSLAGPRAAAELAGVLSGAARFHEDHCVFYGVLSEPPPDVGVLARISGPHMAFLADYDRAVAAAFGAVDAPRTVVLDPLLRAVANIGFDHPDGHGAMLRGLLESLPPPGESAGVPLPAPVLMVPRVLDFALCDALVEVFERCGGEESGFLLDRDGKTATVIDYGLKRRQDVPLVNDEARALVRDRIVRSLLPAIERFFQFRATRMDRYRLCRYDSESGGHFFRHRDNLNAGARHRRFALSINLNKNFEGGELRFPEFGPTLYRPPIGAAAVFSCGMLHEVRRVTRGRRHAFVAFFYDEADAALREAMNANLKDGEAQYVGGRDRLFPVESSP